MISVNFRSILLPIALWLAVFAGSGAMWYALAHNPEWLLYVERRQPAASYDYAQELLREGRHDEALRSYERGLAYFESIYRDSGMERHLLQVVRGLLGIAHVHMYHMGDEGLPEAERIYKEAIELHPYWAGGQPYYSLGMVQNWLGKHAEAERRFDLALERGHGRLEVELVHFGRGLARARQGNLDGAARDWYAFLRYAARNIHPDEWQAIEETPLDEAASPKALFILGLLLERQGHPDAAAAALRRYLDAHPHDPAARFALSRITGVGQPPSAVDPPITLDELDLSHCFPFRDERPYPFLDMRVDLYLPEPGDYEIALTLSGSAPPGIADPPIVEAIINRQPRAELTVRGAAPERHALRVELPAGRSILQLREKWPLGQPIQADLFLHGVAAADG